MTGSTPFYSEIDGEPTISLEVYARMLGQDPKVVRAEYDMQQAINPGNTFTVPAEWIQSGRRITKRVAAEIGSYDGADHLAYWAQKMLAEGNG